MWEMGGGREETRDLPPGKSYLFGRVQFLAPGVICLGDREPLGCLRSRAVKLRNNSPSGSHLLPPQKLTKCLALKRFPRHLAQPQSIFIMHPLHRGKLRPVERRWCEAFSAKEPIP